MTPEIRAAAERLRAVTRDENPYGTGEDDDRRYDSQYCADIRLAVGTFLALTDPAAVDEAWLRSIGFEEESHEPFGTEFKIQFRKRPRRTQYDDLVIRASGGSNYERELHATIAAGGCWPGPIKTRGDVLRLCAALNIETKEPAHD